jgi:tRNA pseudouridine38-40 synthase
VADPAGDGPDSPGLVRLRVDLAYDGAGFHGFARQPDVRTVQGVLEGALARVVGVEVVTTGAGRTDAGVHALGQVVTVDVPAGARILGDLDRARRALDRLCGPEVAIWSVRRAPSGFDARFSARRRRYRYRLSDAEALSPLARHDTWHLGGPPLDVAAMREGSAHLLGEHDFSSFCRRASDEHLVRRLDRLDVDRPDGGLVTFAVEGPAFCHQMVRSLVACLVRVGRRRLLPRDVPAVLAARDRQAVGAVAPPHGLTLLGVDY